MFYLSVLDFLSGELDHPADFRGNAEVFKEPLMGGPELTPHGLLHTLLCFHEVCSLLELLPCCHPLQESCAVSSSTARNRSKVLKRRVFTSFTDLLYMVMYCGVKGTSSILNVTPVKLSCRAMYMPRSFMSMATISMAPTPLKSVQHAGTHV